eukprot:tig00000851_g4915.t1
MAFVASIPAVRVQTSLQTLKGESLKAQKPAAAKQAAFTVVAQAEEKKGRREFVAAAGALFVALAGSPAAFAYSAADANVTGLGGDLTNIDINNANIAVFQKLPGMYPNIAKKIIGGAPYKSVAELYSLDLTEKQKETLRKYEDNFYAGEPIDALGYDAINNGIYK